MTDVSSRPMPTPDLANLLKRPRRPAAESGGPASGSPDTQTLHGDAAAKSVAAEPKTRVTASSKARASSSPSHDVSDNERHLSPAAADVDVTSQPPQTSARQYLRIKSVYLPRSLHQRLGEYADAQKTTRTALILAAINQGHSRLGPYLATDSGSSGGARANDLFDIPQLKKNAEPAVQTTIRITDRQHQAIETLIAQLGTNRSRLVAAALTLYFGEGGAN